MGRLLLRLNLLLAIFLMLGAVTCTPPEAFVQGFRQAVADHQQGRGYNNPTNSDEKYIQGYKAGFAYMSEQAAREVFGGPDYKLGGGDGGAGDGGN